MQGVQVNGKQVAKLIYINGTVTNNNKFYNMQENSDGTFTSSWGRIDSTSTDTIFPMKLWDKKYNEKIKKGYEDKTEIFLDTVSSDDSSEETLVFDDISKEVDAFIKLLQEFANISIKNNYTIATSKVTQKQLETAQSLINDLISYTSVRPFLFEEFNKILLDIYKTLPRRMGNVKDFLLNASTKKDSMERLVEAEQDLLDTLKTQVNTQIKTKTITQDKKNNKSLEETLGLIISPCTSEDEKLIKEMMKGNSNKFVKAFRVTNKMTEQQASDWYKNAEVKFKKDPNWMMSKLFFHGSRNENWFSIINNGLILRPKAIITGKMYGTGCYFANNVQKSIGYCSLSNSYWAKGKDSRGFIGIYEVHLGRVKKTGIYKLHKGEFVKKALEKHKEN